MKPYSLLIIAFFMLATAACSKKLGDDTIAPQIKLLGKDSIYVLKGESLSDPGAIANDDRDGELNSSIVSNWDSIMKINSIGKKTITYKVKDNAGNVASTSRIVYIDFTALMPLGVFNTSISHNYGACWPPIQSNGSSTITATPFKDQFKLILRDTIYGGKFIVEFDLSPSTNDFSKINVISRIGIRDQYGGSANLDPISSELTLYYNYLERQNSIECMRGYTLQVHQVK